MMITDEPDDEQVEVRTSSRSEPKLPKGPATPEKYLARARVRSAEHRRVRKVGRVPERRVFASAIFDMLLARDAFARFHGGTQLDGWFDDVVKRLHRSYDRDAAKRVITALRDTARERRERLEEIAVAKRRLSREEGE